MKTSPCRGKTCRAEVVWAWTGKKPMPVDPEPHADGNVKLTARQTSAGERYEAVVLGPLEVELARGDGAALHMPHWATCADAKDFR